MQVVKVVWKRRDMFRALCVPGEASFTGKQDSQTSQTTGGKGGGSTFDASKNRTPCGSTDIVGSETVTQTQVLVPKKSGY